MPLVSSSNRSSGSVLIVVVSVLTTIDVEGWGENCAEDDRAGAGVKGSGGSTEKRAARCAEEGGGSVDEPAGTSRFEFRYGAFSKGLFM